MAGEYRPPANLIEAGADAVEAELSGDWTLVSCASVSRAVLSAALPLLAQDHDLTTRLAQLMDEIHRGPGPDGLPFDQLEDTNRELLRLDAQRVLAALFSQTPKGDNPNG